MLKQPGAVNSRSAFFDKQVKYTIGTSLSINIATCATKCYNLSMIVVVA